MEWHLRALNQQLPLLANPLQRHSKLGDWVTWKRQLCLAVHPKVGLLVPGTESSYQGFSEFLPTGEGFATLLTLTFLANRALVYLQLLGNLRLRGAEDGASTSQNHQASTFREGVVQERCLGH